MVLYDRWSFIGGTNIYRNVGPCSCYKGLLCDVVSQYSGLKTQVSLYMYILVMKKHVVYVKLHVEFGCVNIGGKTDS